MFKQKFRKIYILSVYRKTGGPRSIHQLGYRLMERGFDVYIYYCSRFKRLNVKEPLYDDLPIKIAATIEDNSSNLVIMPEIRAGWIRKFKNINIFIWWLSLDFYLQNSIIWSAQKRSIIYENSISYNYIYSSYKILRSRIKGIFSLRPELNTLLNQAELKRLYHLYNCDYEKYFLLANSVPEKRMHYLCGPIDKKFMEIDENRIIETKRNIVAYNPAKVRRELIDRIINCVKQRESNVEFIPIENMSLYEVADSLKEAKVYLDLGFFPGPERMPREAVMSYCCIITSIEGAAANNADVPIPDDFKFDAKLENSENIANKVVDSIRNYKSLIRRFDVYRDKVEEQICRFDKDIVEIFEGNFY